MTYEFQSILIMNKRNKLLDNQVCCHIFLSIISLMEAKLCTAERCPLMVLLSAFFTISLFSLICFYSNRLSLISKVIDELKFKI